MSLLSHDRYQTDLSISSSTLATAVGMRCFSSLKLTGSGGTKTLSSSYYANCVSTTLTVLILHNVESVYFFYSNPVLLYQFLHGLKQQELTLQVQTPVQCHDVMARLLPHLTTLAQNLTTDCSLRLTRNRDLNLSRDNLLQFLCFADRASQQYIYLSN